LMSETANNDTPDSVKFFYIYAHVDKPFSYELDKHLRNLQRRGVISELEGRGISIDTDADHHLGVKLDKTDIILLLISPEFLASGYCYGAEMKQILALHRAGNLSVVAALLRSTDLKYSPFTHLSLLLEEPITTYPDRDNALFEIVENIHNAIDSRAYRIPPQFATEPSNKNPEQIEALQEINTNSANIFCAYTFEDERSCNELNLHLRILQRQGVIGKVHYHEIPSIAAEYNTIDAHLYNAKIIIFLISPDFFANNYLFGAEMTYAIQQQAVSKARVIPIIVRSVDWHSSPFDKLQVFPSNTKPVNLWANRDEAFLDIAQGIRAVAISHPLLPHETVEAHEYQQNISEMVINPERVGSGPINIFYSYAHEDKGLLEALQNHMSYLRRQGWITDLSDRDIPAGSDWRQKIGEFLNYAHIILLLVSSDYLASDYCYEVEFKRAMERQSIGDAVVVPIILRPVGWQNTPISHFVVLPSNGIPLTLQSDYDGALHEIATQIRQIVRSLQKQSAQKTKEQLILEGQKFSDNRQYEEALTVYERARLLDAEDDFVCNRIGRLLFLLERHEESLVAYDQALKVAPSASGYLFKGLILQRLGRPAEALVAYQQAYACGYSG
jgi:tetratricopeptide (TPR) repeat protein